MLTSAWRTLRSRPGAAAEPSGLDSGARHGPGDGKTPSPAPSSPGPSAPCARRLKASWLPSCRSPRSGCEGRGRSRRARWPPAQSGSGRPVPFKLPAGRSSNPQLCRSPLPREPPPSAEATTPRGRPVPVGASGGPCPPPFHALARGVTERPLESRSPALLHPKGNRQRRRDGEYPRLGSRDTCVPHPHTWIHTF